MMKKLLLLGFTLGLFSVRTHAQVSTVTPISDTLHYYFNKLHYKKGTLLGAFPYFKAPAANVTTIITHCGSKFENSDPNLEVTGLEAFASRNPSSSQLTIKVHLYLCNLNAQGKPVLPALDSVICTVGGSPAGTPAGSLFQIGGNLIHGPKTVSGDFAVLFRNMSTIAGDTVRLAHTGSKTINAWAPVNGPTWTDKFSDGYGFVRQNAVFYSTTNYTAPGFGAQTDYEFCVAPRVNYTLTVGEQWPVKVVNSETICTHEQIKFTNISSPELTHRMYNLNEFYRKWNLYSPLIVPNPTFWSPDTTVTWIFEPEFYQVGERQFLKYGGNPNSINFYTDSASTDCFNANKFKACHRGMQIYGRSPQLNFVEDFTICVQFCNDDAVGISINKAYDAIQVYPNPAANGKTTLSGLLGKTTLMVYNMLGELIYTEATENEKVLIDLSDKPNGTYLIRVVDAHNNTQVSKLIKQN